MTKIVTVYGGSGFVGRYVARRMANAGWRVRVAVRRPNEAHFVRTFGVVGQVEPVLCNIRDDASVESAMQGADAVVNCVGILAPTGKNTFEAVHEEGAARIARIAAAQHIENLVHISALGADEQSESLYARTKAAGEAAILEHMPQAVILRPSIIFGPEDQFFNRFAGMTRFGPVLPIVGADTKFQPVYVDDVAQAAERALVDGVTPGVYELGGPEVLSFKALMKRMLDVIRRWRLIGEIPLPIARIMASVSEFGQKVTFGLAKAQITRDQVESLQYDNVVSPDARGFEALGIRPTAVDAVLPEYLWRFRPSGQYDAIKESARGLR